jgi:small subunit ribosomal protein S17
MAKVGHGHQKTRVGVVVKDKMSKTVVVAVGAIKRHRLYKKIMRRVTHYKAHDEENACRVGDKVLIVETRPLSRDKRWRVAEVLTTAALPEEEKAIFEVEVPEEVRELDEAIAAEALQREEEAALAEEEAVAEEEVPAAAEEIEEVPEAAEEEQPPAEEEAPEAAEEEQPSAEEEAPEAVEEEQPEAAEEEQPPAEEEAAEAVEEEQPPAEEEQTKAEEEEQPEKEEKQES